MFSSLVEFVKNNEATHERVEHKNRMMLQWWLMKEGQKIK